MAGSDFNRIIGFSRATSGQENDKYILRIPRFEAAQVDHEVAVLQFLRPYSNLPVPEVRRFEETSNNILGSPYMVQKRIPGLDLYSSFLKLDHIDQCRIAQELGQVFHQILSLNSQDAGVLMLPPDNKSLQTPLWVAQFTKTDAILASYSNALAVQSTCSMLTTIFKDPKAAALERRPTDVIRSELMDQFITMTVELNTDALLGNNQNSLYHLDLAPRNIMVDYASDASYSKSPAYSIGTVLFLALASCLCAAAPDLGLE